MKTLIKWATAGAVATLLFSPLSFAQSSPPPPAPTSTVTVQPVSPPPPPGFKVCYMPQPKHIERSRIVQRCGPYGGCQNFRVTRSFDVTAYTDCHLEKYACSRGYKNFGWYPSKSEAKDAMRRCQNTISGNVPGNWNMNNTDYNGDDDSY